MADLTQERRLGSNSEGLPVIGGNDLVALEPDVLGTPVAVPNHDLADSADEPLAGGGR